MKEVDSGVGQGSISRSETIFAMLVERPVGVEKGFKLTDMISGRVNVNMKDDMFRMVINKCDWVKWWNHPGVSFLLVKSR